MVDLAAIRHNVRACCATWWRPTADADGGGQGRRLRPRACSRRRAPPARPGRRGSASRPSTRRSRCASAGRHRPDPVLARPCPDDDCGRRRSTRDVDVTAYSLRRAATRSRGARSRARRARVQLKVDTGLSRGGCAADRLAGAGRRGPRRRGRRRLPGHRHLVALRLQRRAGRTRPTTPRRRAFRDALGRRRGRRARARRCATSPTPRRAILRPSSALRPGALRHRVATASTRRPALSPDLGLRAGDDGAGAARADQADRRGRGRLLRPHLGRRARHDASGWSRWGTPTASRGTPATRAEVLGRRAAPPDPRPDLHGPVRRRPRRRPAAEPGDEVVLFGPGADGEPTAQDWADACGTISYEIVTRIGRPAAPALRRRGDA